MKQQKSSPLKSILNIKWRIIDSLAYHLKAVDNWYTKGIGADYEKEYTTFQISKKDNVMHIGCGGYPLTEYIISERLGAKITGIDNNSKVIQKAKKHQQKHHPNLSNIAFKQEDGTTIDPENYTVIILSSCTTPMSQVLQNLTKKAQLNTSIILRELNTYIPQIDAFLKHHPELKELQRIHHNSGTHFKNLKWQSIHLKKMK